jgi:hypothetical protein
MSNSLRLFIDTSCWIEYLLDGERYHSLISQYLNNQIESQSIFLTSDYVLDEAYTRLLTNHSLFAAETLNKMVEDMRQTKNLMILFTDPTIFQKAWKVFKKYADHRLSFTDATIAVYVQDLKLDTIVTLDRDFALAGFPTTPKLKT